MKFAWIAWWIVSGFWLALFAAGSIFLAQRDVDATGAVQIPEIIMLNIFVLACFYNPFAHSTWLVAMVIVRHKRIQETSVQEFKAFLVMKRVRQQGFMLISVGN
ncbi:DUF3923 family protein [Salicibibacter kimchii]|uniref:DUF3923 family protein n=1 Tax=Salicibibacter kimchii TaxID=2099786 RepID=A0A345C3Z4_9BACI|nr:DUF3923 family protein [Salicibibacter kimchii]